LEQVGVLPLEPWVQPPCPRHAEGMFTFAKTIFISRNPNLERLSRSQRHGKVGLNWILHHKFCHVLSKPKHLIPWSGN
jgi:hypothetical protein